MKKKKSTYIILFAILGTLVLGYFLFASQDGDRYRWYESFNPDNEQPYSTQFIKQLLESYKPEGKFIVNDKKPVHKLLKESDYKYNTVYIFIGQDIYLSEEDNVALAEFISRGNNVFIASQSPPNSLIEKIYVNGCDETFTYWVDPTDTITLNFYHPALRTKHGYAYRYKIATEYIPYHWGALNEGAICDSTSIIIPLGYQLPERINFFAIPYGKGKLYLHSNPIVFTNYFLTNMQKREYASAVFSHLPGKNMVLDEFSKLWFSGGGDRDNGPLYYILQQPSLKYAWWLLLFTVLLYVVFAARRKQRVIPVLEQKTNTSLEFVNMVSALYFQNANHLDMARKKMKYFLYYIRTRYGIQAHTFTEEQMTKLSDKSKVNPDEVRNIFQLYNRIDKYSYTNIESSQLTEFYYAIENFYKNCK